MILFGFASLGFLIGNLIGLSAESTLGVILPLLFAFGGGSAVAFLHKLEPGDRRMAGAAITALSLFCLIGAYTGILVSEHQLLSPASSESRETLSVADRKYLRAIDARQVDLIDARYKARELTAAEAYEALYELASKAGDQ
jgi:hypothetical protein